MDGRQMLITKAMPAKRVAPPEPEAEFDQLGDTVRLGPPQPLVLGTALPIEALRDLGPFRLVRQLGSGGMGIVFEAFERGTGETFAIKVLRPSLAMEPDAKLRFSREAQAMATVSHRRIVPVLRVGEDQGIPYIVMPLLIGETLDDRLQRSPRLTIDETIRIGIEIAEGLGAAHERGLIHRDVKPANVWLEGTLGSVRLLDLGLAREYTTNSMLTQSGIVMGTPSYMSPEQARGEKLDARSDLFSLGTILYQMTVGTRPFDGPTPMSVLQQLDAYHPPRACALNPGVPAMLSNLIMELLAKQPKDRPMTAAVAIERLRRISFLGSSRPPAAPAVTTSVYVDNPSGPTNFIYDSDEPRGRSDSWVVSALAMLLAVSCGCLYLSMR
jgi:serine/threonine protein kinase